MIQDYAQTVLHMLQCEFPQAHPRTYFRHRGGHRGPLKGRRPSYRVSMGGTHPQRDYRHSTKTACGYCGSWPHRSREECKAVGQECYNCGRLRHFSKVCRQRLDYQKWLGILYYQYVDVGNMIQDYAQNVLHILQCVPWVCLAGLVIHGLTVVELCRLVGCCSQLLYQLHSQSERLGIL